MLTRRTFVKNSSLAIAGATLFSKDLFAAGKNKTITGVQLYSVRDEMKKDILPLLKQERQQATAGAQSK